jgi:hypothetical protein
MTVLEEAKIWEGTWEEIASHAEEFKGRRVQLLVFNSSRSANGTVNAMQNEAEPETLDKALAGYIGTIDGPETDISERSEEIWGQYVEEKHRRIKEQGH